MSIRTVAGSFIIHLILAFILGMVFSDYFTLTIFPPSITFKDDTKLHRRIAALQSDRDSLVLDNKVGNAIVVSLEDIIFRKINTVDSLRAVIINIRNQNRRKSVSIDSLIAIDSTNAVELYRLALTNLGVIPDLTEHLTFGEIGHGAKFLSNYQGLELELYFTNYAYDELEAVYDLRQRAFDQLSDVNETNLELAAIGHEQAEQWRTAYEDQIGFWKDRFIFGLGYGGQFNFSTDQLTHGIQFGLYLKLFGL